jgi:DHA2 family multidrug resistance protein
MTARYAAHWGDPVHGHTAAVKKLWLLAYREAQVQTFADAYLAIAACFMLAVLMVAPMRKVGQPARASSAPH